MFTKMATRYTLIKEKSLQFDTTILTGMQTLFEKLESITMVGSESVTVRPGRASSLQK